MQALLDPRALGGVDAAVTRSTDMQANMLQTLFGAAAAGHRGLLTTHGAFQDGQRGAAGSATASRAAAMQGMASMALLRVAAAEFPGAQAYYDAFDTIFWRLQQVMEL